MKIPLMSLACGALLALPTNAQVGTQAGPTSSEVGGYSIAERGAHHQIWQRLTFETNAIGEVLVITNSYTELATGLNFFDEATQQWQPSREEWQVYPDGIVAQAGRHKVILAHNLNLGGSVDVLLPSVDGLPPVRLVSNPVGLGFYDPVDGKQALLAEVKDCAPQWGAATNEIIFRDCFEGIRGSIRYLYTRAGFHQHVVLEQRLQLPEGFSDKTRLEFYTEFAPETPPPRIETRVLRSETDPVRRARMVEPDFTDSRLDFGEMRIGDGVAFTLESAAQMPAILVAKRYEVIAGRPVLIESVEFLRLEPLLARLAVVDQPKERFFAINSSRQISHAMEPARLPREKLRSPSQKPTIALASAPPLSQPAVVMDYELLSSSTNFTFKGDTTYCVVGSVNLSGSTTIEGGTVVKFTNSAAAKITLSGPISCQTADYRPAIFTSKDDDSVGETISTGNPTNINASGLFVRTNGQTLANLRFAYLLYAVDFDSVNQAGQLTLQNAQFFKCLYPLTARQTMCFAGCGATVNLRNALGFGSDVFFQGDIGILRAEHLTLYQCNTFGSDDGNDCTVYLTNSLLVAVTNWGNVPYTTNSTAYSSTDPGGIFQTLGAGAHYLANSSAYRNVGTTNINAELLATLKKKTTYPPTLLSNVTVSTDMTLSLQAWRDTDAPDLGFHYDSLDYLTDALAMTNATLSVNAGVAVASCNGTGIWLQDNSAIVSSGTPTAPNYFVRYQSVQEQPVALGGSNPSSAITVYPYHYGSVGPNGTFRFTRFASPAGGGSHLHHALSSASYNNLSVQDCELWNGQNNLKGPANPVSASVSLRNNLFHRSSITTLVAVSTNATLSFSNNLVYGTTVTLRQPTGIAWEAHDNAFDSCTISTSSSISNSHNAYINCTNQFSGSAGSDIVLTNALGYQSGPLGDFYQPTNSPLINTGSTTANLSSLYHFTTVTNQVKETNSTVDIGLHYIAVTTNGVPFDTDSDGLADYFEDSNGNGLFDGGEVYNWTNAFTLANGLSDLQNYQLTFNVLVNDRAQDYANEQNTQDETTLIAFGNNVICAFVDSNLGVPGYGQTSVLCNPTCTSPPPGTPQFIGWSVSRDGGQTFTDRGSLPLFTNTVDGVTNVYGNAGDPVLARDDSSGMIYLVGNPQRPSLYYPDGTNQPAKVWVPLWRSTNNGDSFLPPINALPGITATSVTDTADKPALVVDNSPGQGNGNVYLAVVWNKAGTPSPLLLIYRASAGATNWTKSAEISVTGGAPEGPALTVSSNHDVYVVYGSVVGTNHCFFLGKSTDLGTNFTVADTAFLTNNFVTFDLRLTRSSSSSSNDYFRTPILPTLVANPRTNGHIYLVYHDSPPTASTDKANIYFLQSTNGGTNWSAPIQVNNVSTNDQWQPVMTIKPDGTVLFIGWYDRRNDSSSNAQIQTFGVIAQLPVADGNGFATNFVISTTNFPPAFTGTTMTNAGDFDPSYPPDFGPNDSRCCQSFRGIYAPHMGDYDTAVSDISHFYYTWGDNRDTSIGTITARNQANVRSVKVSWPR